MAEVILNPGTFMDLPKLTPDECADRARNAGFDGIEWVATRAFVGRLSQAMMKAETRASIKAAQQSFRTEKNLWDMVKWVGRYPSLKAPFIVGGSFLTFEERIASLKSIQTLQSTVLGRPLMVNVYPPHDPSEPTGTEYGFAEALIQPGSNALVRLGARNVNQLEMKRQEFGYNWILDPSFAQELGDLRDVLPVLAPHVKMIRLCPTRVDMFRNSNIDYLEFLLMMRDLGPEIPIISILAQGAPSEKLVGFKDRVKSILT